MVDKRFCAVRFPTAVPVPGPWALATHSLYLLQCDAVPVLQHCASNRQAARHREGQQKSSSWTHLAPRRHKKSNADPRARFFLENVGPVRGGGP